MDFAVVQITDSSNTNDALISAKKIKEIIVSLKKMNYEHINNSTPIPLYKALKLNVLKHTDC